MFEWVTSSVKLSLKFRLADLYIPERVWCHNVDATLTHAINCVGVCARDTSGRALRVSYVRLILPLRNLGFLDITVKLLLCLQAKNPDGSFEGTSQLILDFYTLQPLICGLCLTCFIIHHRVTKLCVVASSSSVTWQLGTKWAKTRFGGRVSRIFSCECCALHATATWLLQYAMLKNGVLNTVKASINIHFKSFDCWSHPPLRPLPYPFLHQAAAQCQGWKSSQLCRHGAPHLPGWSQSWGAVRSAEHSGSVQGDGAV